ncbi:MAG: hypothetical protein ACUVQK_12305, partial [Thermogutta sp.]
DVFPERWLVILIFGTRPILERRERCTNSDFTASGMQDRTKLSAEGGPMPAHEWIGPSSACLSRAIAITLEKARLPFG